MSVIKHIHIDGTKLNVPALCLGTSGFGTNISESQSYTQMDSFFEKGGNFLDTARIYSDLIPGEKGRCERIVGDYFKDRKTRDSWLIATKGGHPLLSAMNVSRVTREQLTSDIDSSLKTLRTDYIDLYYLHRDNTKVSVKEIIDWMNEFVAAGKIRYFGCSNWKTQRIREAQQYSKDSGKMGFCANQPLWNVGCYSMAAPDDKTMVVMDKQTIDFHKEFNMTAIPYSSQAGGFFSKLSSTNHSVKQDALQSSYASSANSTLFPVIKALAEKYKVPITKPRQMFQ